jgi:hypothetical protein
MTIDRSLMVVLALVVRVPGPPSTSLSTFAINSPDVTEKYGAPSIDVEALLTDTLNAGGPRPDALTLW